MFKTLILAAFVAGLLGGSAAAKEVAFDHGVLAETASESASPDKFIVAELFDEDGVKGESDDAQHEKSYW
jgi:hypothetical protein